MCREKIKFMTKQERKEFLFREVSSCIIKVTDMGSYKIRYAFGPLGSRVVVCKKAFQYLYDIGKTYMDTLIKHIKNCDRSPDIYKLQLNFSRCGVIACAKMMNLQLTAEEVMVGAISTNRTSLATAVWMKNHFNLLGDQQPNTNGQIHLDTITKRTVYKEYEKEWGWKLESIVSYATFTRIWRESFRHVKIRKFKGVTGSN